jgi:hypothetical protein
MRASVSRWTVFGLFSLFAAQAAVLQTFGRMVLLTDEKTPVYIFEVI